MAALPHPHANTQTGPPPFRPSLETARRKYLVKDRGETLGPSLLRVRCLDEVVADFDQHIRPARLKRVPVDRVARKMAVVGLVVADAEIGFLPQAVDQNFGEARVER